MIIPNIWENKTCSKPPTRNTLHVPLQHLSLQLSNAMAVGNCWKHAHSYSPIHQLMKRTHAEKHILLSSMQGDTCPPNSAKPSLYLHVFMIVSPSHTSRSPCPTHIDLAPPADSLRWLMPRLRSVGPALKHGGPMTGAPGFSDILPSKHGFMLGESP